MKNPTRAPRKTSSRPIVVCALALLTASCGSGSDGTGSGGRGGNGGAQGTAGRGGSSGAAGTSGGAGTGGSTGTAGTSGTGGTGGTTGGGGAGTTGTGGSAGASGRGGATAGTTGTGGVGQGGSAGRGGQGGTGGSASGGAGGAAGRGGTGGSAGAGGGTGTGGTPDGGSTDAVVQDGATMTGGAFVRTAWTAAYTCTGTCPAQGSSDTADADTKRAFDGNRGTRWSTGQYQETATLKTKFPLYFTVDMKQVVNVSRITLDAGTQDTYDAPGQMDVLLSVDGTNYTTIAAAHKPVSPMTGATDTIMFTQTPARYIQLKATMTIKQVSPSLGDRYWAIGEMNVYP